MQGVGSGRPCRVKYHRPNGSKVFLLVVACLAAAHASAFAGQVSGPVSGVVLDASGAPVAGASVTIEVKGKPARTVETTADGRFSLDEATGTEGMLRVRANGFALSETPLGTDVSALRVVLQPRPLTESVTVTASRGAAGVDTAASATIVSSAELLTSAAGRDRRRAAQHARLQPLSPLVVARRESHDAGRHAAWRVRVPARAARSSSPTAGRSTIRSAAGCTGIAIPLAAVDRIEVVRGATGDLYGADALGGVIQVLTLDAERPRLRGLFEGGSHDTYRASGFGGRRFGNWAVSGGAEVQSTDGAVHRR